MTTGPYTLGIFSKTSRLFALLLSFALAACGGSGDSSPGNGSAGTGSGGSSGSGTGGGSGGGSPSPTYSIGGSVVGMTGSGLIISNNAAEQLTIDAAGDFVFPGELDSGVVFDVQIVAQPANPSNVCTIENGSGTIAAADISNIEIVCTGPLLLTAIQPADSDADVSRAIAPLLTFSADIDPATVVPANIRLSSAAGETDVTLGTNGSEVTMTPESVLLPLTEYTLSVTTDILGSDGERLLDPQSVVFTTRDALWYADIEIDASTGTANDADVAFDLNGNALAVWYQQGASGTEVWWNLFTSGVGWGTAEVLEATPPNQFAGSPKAGFDPGGNAVAVWTLVDPQSGTDSLRSSQYMPGTGWSPSTSIDTQSGDIQGNVEFVINDSGDAVAAWTEFDGRLVNVWANRFTTANGWGVAEIVDEDDDVVEKPRISINARGDVLAAWTTRFSGNLIWDVWARRYVVGSGWQPSTRLSTNSNDPAISPRPVIDNDSIGQVIWLNTTNQLDTVFASRQDIAGNWSTPQEVGSAPSIDDPEFALDSAGNSMAIWRHAEDANGSRELLPYAARHSVSSGWGAAEPVGNLTAFYPKIEFDASGHGLAIWFELDLTRASSDGYSVWGNRYTNGAGWTSAEQIGSNGGLIGSYMPRLAIDPNGDAFAIWARGDEVRVNRFE